VLWCGVQVVVRKTFKDERGTLGLGRLCSTCTSLLLRSAKTALGVSTVGRTRKARLKTELQKNPRLPTLAESNSILPCHLTPAQSIRTP
jgi:hypothetical protein